MLKLQAIFRLENGVTVNCCEKGGLLLLKRMLGLKRSVERIFRSVRDMVFGGEIIFGKLG